MGAWSQLNTLLISFQILTIKSQINSSIEMDLQVQSNLMKGIHFGFGVPLDHIKSKHNKKNIKRIETNLLNEELTMVKKFIGILHMHNNRTRNRRINPYLIKLHNLYQLFS